MGMYDTVKCQYALPDIGVTDIGFQTKSLGNFLNDFEIREDGTLWKEVCDYEDHSDPNALGISRLAGMMTPVNCRWVQVEGFTGEVKLNSILVKYKGKWQQANWSYQKHKYLGRNPIWYDVSIYFVDGKVKEVHRLPDRKVPGR